MGAKDEIERLGATVIVDESFILKGPDNESQVLDALMEADEILFIKGSSKEFLDRRYPWIALGAATGRELPMFLLLAERVGNEGKKIPEIPTVFNKMKRLPDLKTYLSGLRRRLDVQHIHDPPSVFFSYSHEDRSHLNELQRMLFPMVQNRCFSVWWDDKIKPSQVWRQEIDQALATAKVGVLLVSTNFLTSEFISNYELKYLLNSARRKRRHVTLLWVLVEHCLYEHTEIAQYQAAHQNLERPLNSYPKTGRQRVLREICKTIEAACSLRTGVS
jgi:hypothetical protein